MKSKDAVFPGSPWEDGAAEIFDDDQEKPTFNSTISDWPLSSKETPPYNGASGHTSMQDV